MVVGGEVDRDGADQLRAAPCSRRSPGSPTSNWWWIWTAEVACVDAGGIAALLAGRDAAAAPGCGCG